MTEIGGDPVVYVPDEPKVTTRCAKGLHVYTFGSPPRPGTTYVCANCGGGARDGRTFYPAR